MVREFKYRLLSICQESGYNVYLVDEFRTSCKCLNPRPWKDIIITRNELLACKTCKGLWNRDENSSRNIYKIIKSHIDGLYRPNYLSRKLFKGATSATL